MLATLIALTTLGFQGQENKATSILKDMIAAMKAANTIELTLQTMPDIIAKAMPYKAHVRLSREPKKYWAKIEQSDQGPEEYSAYADKKLTYTEEDGKRQTVDIPFWNALRNRAAEAGVQAWQNLCDWERFEKGLSGSHYYVMQDEIEGKVCDMVGVVHEGLLGTSQEKILSILYVWVDRETHLARAFQHHTLGRGRSALFPKMAVRDLVLNPAWKGDVFAEIPEQVGQSSNKKRPAPPEPETKGIKTGAACPDLDVQTIDMKTVKLAGLVKQDALVTFWAPWCGPCIAEMKALMELPEVKSGALRVIAVGAFDSKQNIRKYARENRLPFTIAIDPDCELKASTLTSTLGVGAIPHAFLFRKGKLARQWIGFDSKEALLRELKGN